ncbi:hypothetical protein H0H81_011857 [Sphagnurus paluster]|uniref:TECPR1-like DysF domain-containing protein n=1 Tax=Sphagnurus paluster TaxID=117069 RepID=A0A9P7GP52_9AGAR|nr:hypothetical protein H0H81_011857 [Sphagnurus paluster]
MSVVVVVVDFLKSIPPPLTVALVQLAPILAAARHGLQLLSWRRSWYDATLAVAAWWALCLFSSFALRYLLPVLVLLAVCIPASPKPAPTTEQTLQSAVTDLTTIHALLPARPSLRPSKALVRVAALLYIPYLLVTYFVPLPILFALAGTAILTARAPFTLTVLAVFQRSAWLRWSARSVAAFLTGQPLPPVVLSLQPTPASPTPVPSLRFLFTIYENQRWWMGLDWTAALLPSERPSWCTHGPAYQPVSPPNAFSLPAPTTVFIPDTNGRRVKRTAIWRWDEPEWKVLVRRDGAPLSRVERPIPEDGPTPSPATGLLGKMRESGIISGDKSPVEETHSDVDEDNISTDPDGWVYGDNKWEGASGKGGIGKYTRYRRWTRIARVHESVEVVDDGPLGVEQSVDLSAPAVGTMALPAPSSPDEESPLRQRLRRALSKPSNNTVN